MSFRVGDVVHVSGLPIYPKKGKYAVFINVAPNQFFLVNSENREHYDCVPFLKNERDFPAYDCFIGCKKIWEAEDSQIDSSHGKLDNNELNVLIEKIKASRYISKVKSLPIITAIEAELKHRSTDQPFDT